MWKQRAIRVLLDVGALVIAGAIILLCVFAYHGQQAYVVLNQILAAQAAQAGQAPTK